MSTTLNISFDDTCPYCSGTKEHSRSQRKHCKEGHSFPRRTDQAAKQRSVTRTHGYDNDQKGRRSFILNTITFSVTLSLCQAQPFAGNARCK